MGVISAAPTINDNGTTWHDLELTNGKIAGSFSSVLFDNDLSAYYVIGPEIPVPHGHWTFSGIYLFVGSGDPYCYYELAYDTWWFERNTWKEHCLEVMRKKKCVYLESYRVADEMVLLEVKHIERCLGLQGSMFEIEHDMRGWKKVMRYTTEPYSVTTHGNLYAIVDEHIVYQISPLFMEVGLWYRNGSFHNYKLVGGSRMWIKPNWLKVTQAKTYHLLVQQIQWYWLDYTQIIKHKNVNGKECNTILSNDAKAIIPNTKNFRKSRKHGEWQITCGQYICACTSEPFNYFLETHPETISYIDEEVGFLSNLINWIERTFLRCLSWLVESIIGQNWQLRAISITIIYYLIWHITKNVIVASVLSFIIIWTYYQNLN